MKQKREIDVLRKKRRNIYDILREVYLLKLHKTKHNIIMEDVNLFLTQREEYILAIMKYTGFDNQIYWHNARIVERRDYEKSINWDVFRKKVLQNYNYICPINGIRALSLNIHHIDGCYTNNKTTNLIPLTSMLHQVIHSGFKYSSKRMNEKRENGFECCLLSGKRKVGREFFGMVAGYLFYLRMNGYPNAGLFLDLDGLYRIDVMDGIFEWSVQGKKYLEQNVEAQAELILIKPLFDIGLPKKKPVGYEILGNEKLSYIERLDKFLIKFYSGLELKKCLRFIDYYEIPRVVLYDLVLKQHLLFRRIKKENVIKLRILHPKWVIYKKRKKLQ